MQRNLTERAHDFREQAEDCARKAQTASTTEIRNEFLHLQQSWLELAQSCEFVGQISEFSVNVVAGAFVKASAERFPLFSSRDMSAEAIGAMSEALNRVCKSLGEFTPRDPTTEVIAKKIMGLAQEGVLDEEELVKLTLEAFRLSD